MAVHDWIHRELLWHIHSRCDVGKSDFVRSFLDPHDDAHAYWGRRSSLVGDCINYCAHDHCHLHLRADLRAHLSFRHIDVRTKAKPEATGETGAHEIERELGKSLEVKKFRIVLIQIFNDATANIA